MDRIVFHIDVNSAFLSWSALYRMREQGELTDLREIPSAVGGDEEARHGVVLAKSSPAKKYGVTTGEPLAAARRKCPSLVVVRPNFKYYVEQSDKLIALLKRYSDQVIQYSIDEAWMILEGCQDLYGEPESFANRLREEIFIELGFTVNIGVSTNKLLSKMAGDFKKPNLVHTLFPDEIEKKLWPLPVDYLLFVGKSAKEKLRGLGIFTVGDLARADVSMLRAHMKKHGEDIWNYAWGRESEELFEVQEANKGYGNSTTTPVDVVTMEYARQILLSLCETVGLRLRADGMKASCVQVSMRTTNFENSSRQMQLDSATDVTEELYQTACTLFERLWDGRKPLRLLGVSATKLTKEEYRQYSLFDNRDYEKLEKCNKAMDSIRARFGENAVMRASFLNTGVAPVSGGLSKEKSRRQENTNDHKKGETEHD